MSGWPGSTMEAALRSPPIGTAGDGSSPRRMWETSGSTRSRRSPTPACGRAGAARTGSSPLGSPAVGNRHRDDASRCRWVPGGKVEAPRAIVRPVDLDGAVVLVAGASSGIGRATALRLAKQGAHVIALGRDRAALEDAAGRTGGRAIVADVGVAADVDRAVAEAHDTYGRVDVLVNNAGFGIAGPFVMTEPEEAERLIRVNLLGAIQLTGALLPGMIERGRGHVVNVSSIAGHVG